MIVGFMNIMISLRLGVLIMIKNNKKETWHEKEKPQKSLNEFIEEENEDE